MAQAMGNMGRDNNGANDRRDRSGGVSADSGVYHDRLLAPLRFVLLAFIGFLVVSAVAFRFIHPDQALSATDVSALLAILGFCGAAWGIEWSVYKGKQSKPPD